MDEPLSLPAANSRRIRLGIVGLGHIFRTCHEPALLHLRKLGWPFDLVAIADTDADALAATSARWPEATAYTDAHTLLEDDKVHATMLLLPTRFMPDASRSALQRKATVFLEKPVAHDTTTLLELIALSQQTQCRVLVGYNRRYQQLAAAFREAFDNCNAPLRIEVNLLRDRRKEPNFYHDVLGHPLSFIAATFGPITDTTHEVGDTLQGTQIPSRLIMRGKAGGHPFSLRLEPSAGCFQESYEITGEHGSVRLDYGSPLTTDACLLTTSADGASTQRVSAAKDADNCRMIASQGFTGQMAHWLRFAANDDHAPACSLQDALDIWELVAGAVKAMRLDTMGH